MSKHRIINDMKRTKPEIHVPHYEGLSTRASDGTRTRDLLITNQLLYQLSYTGVLWGKSLLPEACGLQRALSPRRFQAKGIKPWHAPVNGRPLRTGNVAARCARVAEKAMPPFCIDAPGAAFWGGAVLVFRSEGKADRDIEMARNGNAAHSHGIKGPAANRCDRGLVQNGESAPLFQEDRLRGTLCAYGDFQNHAAFLVQALGFFGINRPRIAPVARAGAASSRSSRTSGRGCMARGGPVHWNCA